MAWSATGLQRLRREKVQKYEYCEQVVWSLEQLSKLSNEQLIMMALAELLETVPSIDKDKPGCRALADTLQERANEVEHASSGK